MKKTLKEFSTKAWLKSAQLHDKQMADARKKMDAEKEIKHLKLRNRAVSHMKHATINKMVKEEYLEATDLPGIVNENSSIYKGELDPPAMLIMRRKFIRTYPNGQRVALYYVDKINKYVTVPYTGMQWGNATAEAVEPNILQDLEDITENGQRLVEFDDGSTSKVDTMTARLMIQTYKALNEDNQKKFLEIAQASVDDFNRALDFARKQNKR